jgi:hypothetical protein
MDRLTNEVTRQCLFYGFYFVNSVNWIKVLAGYAVACNSKRNLYWCVPCNVTPVSSLKSSRCFLGSHLLRTLVLGELGSSMSSRLHLFHPKAFQLCNFHQTSLLCWASRVPNVPPMVGLNRSCMVLREESSRKIDPMLAVASNVNRSLIRRHKSTELRPAVSAVPKVSASNRAWVLKTRQAVT